MHSWLIQARSPDGPSDEPSISADGRYVAFSSDAANLVIGDSNAVEDVFVHDRATGLTGRVSVGAGAIQANGVSSSPSISADGRYVAFGSRGSNLVSGDTNASSDAFVRDRLLVQTTRVSVAASGAQAARSSVEPSISGDGSRVAFESLAALHGSDANGTSDVYVRDRGAGATTWISSGADLSNNGRNYSPSISPNGRWVAFASDAPLDPQDANGVRDVYEFDLVGGTGTQISADDELGRRGDGASDAPTASNAERVAFASMASNFSACYPDYCDDNNLVEDVLIHDWVPDDAGTTSASGSSASGPSGPEPDCVAWGASGPESDHGQFSPLAGSHCKVRPAVPRRPRPPRPDPDDLFPPPVQPPVAPDECESWEHPSGGAAVEPASSLSSPRHHIATNKNPTAPSTNRDGSKGKPWTQRFEDDVFGPADLYMNG